MHVLRFIRRARDLGFSLKEIKALLGLWENRRRASGDVKRLAMKHVDELDRRIAEMQAMRAVMPAPPKGRTLVLGAGKAGGAMAAAFDLLWPREAAL